VSDFFLILGHNPVPKMVTQWRNHTDVVIVDQSESRHYHKSEDEWEEISGDENRGDLHEEPVEVYQPDQSASVTDIQSMQSSNAGFHELSQSETDLKGRTD
jgi:hypothetical protein